MKKQSKSPGLPAWLTPSAVVAALGVALLAFSQFWLLSGKVGRGVTGSLIGFTLLGLAWLLPKDLLARIKGAAGSAADLKKSLKNLLSEKPKAKAKAAPEGEGGPWWKKEWRFINTGTLHVSRLLLVGIGAVLVILSQWFILRGSLTLGFVVVGLGIVMVAVYLQDMAKPVEIPYINENLRTLILLIPGIPFQFFGASMLWHYQHVFKGYALVSIGCALWLFVLYRWPFRFLPPEEEADAGLSEFTPSGSGDSFSLRSLLIKASLVAGAALLALSAGPVYTSNHQGLALGMRIGAIMLLLASFPWLPFSVLTLPLLPPLLRGLAAIVMGLGAFALGMHGQTLISTGHKAAGLWWFLAGAIVLVLALRPSDLMADAPAGAPAQGKEKEEGSAGPGWMRWAELAGFAALMLMAFYQRYHRVGLFPYTAEGDEAGGGLLAWDILHGKIENFLVHQNIPLFPFEVTSLFIKYFGLTVGTMRAHVVIFGTLSVATTYFCLRFLFKSGPAFLATLLMALAYWHLHYSRFGHYNIEQVFYQMASFYFLFKGMRARSFWHFTAGGFAFGFAMLPHLSSRLLPFAGILMLLYWLLARRDVLRRHFNGFLVFVLASWMLASPALTYWFRAIPLSMGRAKSVSVFDRTNTNAPADVYAGIVHNIKTSFMMFNDYSDSRPRNNPIAPEKILEHWSAILFALSFLYCLYYWRQPLNFFFSVLFTVILAASIFSVEAPQTLRTAGNISVVFSLMASLLHDFRRAFATAFPRRGAWIFLLLLLPAFGFFGYRSWNKYFVERKGQQFDVLPTLIGQEAARKAKENYGTFFYATGFASGHPPILLFKEGAQVDNFFIYSETLPLNLPNDKGYVVILCDEYDQAKDWVKSLYPEAGLRPLAHEVDGTYYGSIFDIPLAVKQKYWGLRAEIETAKGLVVKDNAPLAWPMEGGLKASRVTWKGTVFMERAGFYRFTPQGSAGAQVHIDGKLVSSGAGQPKEIALGMGLHKIKVSLFPGSGKFELSLSGRPLRQNFFYNYRGQAGPIQKNYLFMYPEPMGYNVEYYINGMWQGDPVTMVVEPFAFSRWLDAPLPGIWSSRYRAKIRIDEPGIYQFRCSTASFSEARVDGRVVSRSGGLPQPMDLDPVVPPVVLGKGWHTLEYRFSTAGHPWSELRWTPPGQGEGPIPADRLRPIF